MTSLRCFVVDDEPLAVKMLENFIARTPFLELVASFTDPVLALSEMRTQAPDLVFLDIQMPDLSGMELSRMVPPAPASSSRRPSSSMRSRVTRFPPWISC